MVGSIKIIRINIRMTDKQEKVIKEMQELSKDRILPSSDQDRALYQRARKYFRSWEKAAIAAGLKTVKMQELEKLQSKQIKTRFYFDRFLIALRLAEKKGLKGEEIVIGCMEAARKGVLDEYKII